MHKKVEEYFNSNTNSNEIKLLFFDTETTGVPKNYKAPASDLYNWPRLVQLGYLIYDANGTLITSGNHIIKPDNFTIPIESSAIHGITTQKAIDEGVDLVSVLLEIRNHIENVDYLVAHNMAFDEKILGAEFLRNNMLNIIENKTKICTMESSIEFCAILNSYGYKWPKLSELHFKLFGYDFDGAHDAFSDIEATAKCFWELKKNGLVKLSPIINNKRNDEYIQDFDDHENESLSVFETKIKNDTNLVPYRNGKFWGLSDIKKNIILNCDYDKINFTVNGFLGKKNSIYRNITESGIETSYLVKYSEINSVLLDTLDDEIEHLEISNPNSYKCISTDVEMVSYLVKGPIDLIKKYIEVQKAQLAKDHKYVTFDDKTKAPLFHITLDEAMKVYENGVLGFSFNDDDEEYVFVDTTLYKMQQARIKGCKDESTKTRLISRQVYKKEKFIELLANIKYVRLEECFDIVCDFSEGLAAVCIGNMWVGKWGFVDINGNIVIPLIYDLVQEFSEGLAAVCLKENFEPKCGFIDKKGIAKTKFIYDYLDYGPEGHYCGVGNFKNGKAAVRINEKFGFIDKNGNTVVRNLYSRIREFSDGLAAVEKEINKGEYKWGFVNENGVEVVKCIYSEVGDFQNGLAPAQIFHKNEKDVRGILKMGFINKKGDIVIPFIYDKLKPFCDGLAIATLRKVGFIDKTGATIIPFEYIDADDFSEGIAMVRKKLGRWCYIDKNNREVFSQDFHNANPFKNGFAKVQKLGFDWGYIDINGNEFWEDSIEQIREAIDVALRMNYLIQFKYQKSEIFNSGEISFRTIKPHAFEQIGQSLCVKGHCYLRGANRTFSLERMSELIIDP